MIIAKTQKCVTDGKKSEEKIVTVCTTLVALERVTIGQGIGMVTLYGAMMVCSILRCI